MNVATSPTSAPTTAAPRGPVTARNVVSYLGGAFLGGVLLVATYAKVLDPVAFAEMIRAEGLEIVLSAGAIALIAIALEAALGTALVLGLRRLFILVPTTLLVVFFLFLTGRTYVRFLRGEIDESTGCGCFGNLVERTPPEAFWGDVLLMVPALLLAWLGWRSARGALRLRLAIVGAVTLATVVVAWRAPTLPLDDLATRLRPGVEVEAICAGAAEERVCLSTLAPWLEDGEHLVVIADLEDESFGAAVPDLNEAALAGTALTVLSSAEPEARNTFFWSWGPAFEITETPEPMLRPLYRELPRSFRVVDGEVVETWAGLPPALTPLPPSPGDD